MNYQKQSLLTAIKTSILHQHLTPLIEKPHPQPYKNKTPFEVYQYDQQLLDYEEVEKKIREQILFKFNQYLYEDEYSKLQMEMFNLDQAIEIQKNQISLLKIHIEAQRLNAKVRQKIQLESLNQANTVQIQNQVKQSPICQIQVKSKQTQIDKSKLNIYPCIRVDIEPPKKALQLLTIPSLQQKEVHIKSHRQLIATYTKRSDASSQENPNIYHKENSLHEQINQTIKQASMKSQKNEQQNLIGLERQITFMERAWQNAKQQGKSALCRKYKKQLMDLVSQFWKISAK